MRKVLETSGVALAGLLTSLLTAVIVTVFNMWTDFNLFTFSVWVVVPVGAILCGFAAASGYYLAARYLHQHPTKLLLLQMIVIAAFTQLLIYWLEYQLLVIEGTHIATVMPFYTYLNISLTTAHLKIGRTLQSDTGEVGSFGYWLAFFDFIGFIVGGAAVYFSLKGIPTCEACNKYLRSALTKNDKFSNSGDFMLYYDNVYTFPVDGPEFARHVSEKHAVEKDETGTITLITTVFECPQCFGQAVRETVSVSTGQDWQDIDDLKRFVEMPKGIDVRPAFR